VSSRLPIAEQDASNLQGYHAVADTMAVVLHLENRRMPPAAKAFFTRAEQAQGTLGIAAITLAEIGYLAEKRRIKLTPADVVAYSRRYPAVRVLPLTAAVVQAAFRITDIAELHDRLIAGTAVELMEVSPAVVVLTNDPVIALSTFVKTLWG